MIKAIKKISKKANGKNSTSKKFSAPIIRPNGQYANEKDLQILRSIFKWKILPASTCKLLCSPSENPRSFEKRIERLLTRRMLQRIDHIGKLRVLQLSQEGFIRFKNDIDGLKEDGYASELVWHDFLTVAFQLGIWAAGKPRGVDLITEQELRRYFKHDLPHWLPNVDSHRPDGFTRFKTDSSMRMMAYEVEMSRKTIDRYDSVAQYYSRTPQVEYILWLVKDPAIMTAIQKCVTNDDSSRLGAHHFILFDDFKDKFWDAKFVAGHKRGTTLIQLMSECSGFNVEIMSEACRETVTVDFTKKILKGLNR